MLYSERTHIKQYLGYDPIDNDYKVSVCSIKRAIPKPRNKCGLVKEIHILTLGAGSSWRVIQGNIPHHSPISQGLCINGVLYYRAFTGKKLNNHAIMSFDVRSEKLDLIIGPCMFRKISELTSYEGKLAVIFFERKSIGVIALWVLETTAKEEWSKKTFVLPNINVSKRFLTTDDNTGEIIIALTYDVHA